MNRSIRFLCVLIVLLNLSVLVAAQATTGRVVVTVTDQTGVPIPGAIVLLKPQTKAAGGIVSKTTDGDGIAEFVNVAPGRFVVEASADQFRTFAQDMTVYTVRVEKIDISLRVGDGSTDVIDIPDPRAKPRDVVVAEGEDIPPSTPNYRSVLDTIPSTRLDALAAGISIDGATGPDNTYFIDGQEVTNPSLGVLNRNHNLPFPFLQEVSVDSGAQRAEYNGSIGGVVNVVTQGGNDRWRGDVGFSFAPSGLNGGWRPILNRYGASTGQFEYFAPNKDNSNAYFPHASVGGPVVKERLWFFGSYSPQFFQNKRTVDYYDTGAPNRTITQTIDYKEDIRQELAFIRLDTQPAKTIKGTISFLYNPTIQEGRLPSVSEGLSGVPQSANGLTGAGLLATQGGRNNSNMVNGSVTWTPISKLFFNFRAGRVFLNEKLNSYGANDQTRYLCSSAGTPQNVPGSNCSPGFSTSVNYTNRVDANTRTSASFDGGLVGINALGRHQIRMGYQYDRVNREVEQGYADTGYIVLYYGISITNLVGLSPTGSQCDYTMSPNPTNCWSGSGFMQRFGIQGDTLGTNQAFYGQDTWRIGDRVTLDLGFRFENERAPVYGSALYGQLPNTTFGWNDKVSPRFGAAVDIFGDGKTRVFGSHFWNYDRMKSEIFESLGADVFARDYFEILPERGVAFNSYTYDNILGGDTDPNNEQCPIVNGPGYSRCRFGFRITTNIPVVIIPPPLIDPELKPTKQKVYLFGISQELGMGFTFSGRYVHKVLDNAIEDIGIFNDQGSEQYFVTNPGGRIACEVAMSALHPCYEAERKYDAVEVGIDKRFSDYFFSANYTWSRLYGNYSGLASSDEFGRVDPNETRTFDLPFQAYTANGVPNNDRMASDRPHVVKAFGGYSHRWNGDQTTDVSAFTTFQSGTPLTTYYSLYGIDTSILFGRGDLGRTDVYSETDLRLGHKFSVGNDGRYKFELYSEILNLFDESNELSRQTSISSTNFTGATLTSAGCTTCPGEASVFHTLFNLGGIEQFVLNHLNAQGTGSSGFRNDYNQPNRFQLPRSVRFGFRLRF